MSGASSGEGKAELALRELGLSYPETTEEFPWGHRTLKVKGKAFIFMGQGEDGSGFSLSVKLPDSGSAALGLPFTQPTGYGLGKSGWVSAEFKPGHEPPVELLKHWLRESYLAVAPKKLAAQLLAGSAPATAAAASGAGSAAASAAKSAARVKPVAAKKAPAKTVAAKKALAKKTVTAKVVPAKRSVAAKQAPKKKTPAARASALRSASRK